MPVFCDNHCGDAKIRAVARTMPARAKRNKYSISERVMLFERRCGIKSWPYVSLVPGYSVNFGEVKGKKTLEIFGWQLSVRN